MGVVNSFGSLFFKKYILKLLVSEEHKIDVFVVLPTTP